MKLGLCKVLDMRDSLLKNLKKAQEKEALKRREFEASLEKLWDISTPDADFLIRADRLHDQDSRSEDRTFLKDQKGARQMELGEPDMRYGEASENKEGRQVNKNKQDVKGKNRAANVKVSHQDDGEEEESDVEKENADPDYIYI